MNKFVVKHANWFFLVSVLVTLAAYEINRCVAIACVLGVVFLLLGTKEENYE